MMQTESEDREMRLQRKFEDTSEAEGTEMSKPWNVQELQKKETELTQGCGTVVG